MNSFKITVRRRHGSGAAVEIHVGSGRAWDLPAACRYVREVTPTAAPGMVISIDVAVVAPPEDAQ
jgi:hypothetical protein